MTNYMLTEFIWIQNIKACIYIYIYRMNGDNYFWLIG